ncbi:MAG: hypothetical protein Pg6C_18410 [Treponemataceae bacterium]|nr:MAG: hypothetical protein Pg6C_18410 [Treponemataceae bacterium]
MKTGKTVTKIKLQFPQFPKYTHSSLQRHIWDRFQPFIICGTKA